MSTPIRSHLAVALFTALAMLAIPCAFAAEAKLYGLQSRLDGDDLTQVAVRYEAGGLLLVHNHDDKEQKLSMRVDARFKYHERWLDRSDTAGPMRRGLRYYNQIDAKLTIGDGNVEPQLRPQHRLVAVNVKNGESLLYSPSGPFTRDELDLIRLPGDSLVVDLLLPKKRVKIGSKWQPSDTALALLLGIDAVGSAKVDCVLYDVSKRFAKMQMSGTLHGAIDGIAVEIDVKARYYFDLSERMVTGFQLHMTEKRPVGHTGPGVDVTSNLQIDIAPLAKSAPLADPIVDRLPPDPPAALKRLVFTPESGHFRFEHDRRWHVAADLAGLSVFRLIDRGDLVAQCNITALPPLRPGERIQLAGFQRDIEYALGKSFHQFVSAKEYTDRAGHVVFRVAAIGNVSSLPIEWTYYLISDKQGRRVAMVFTTEEKTADRFAGADLPIVATLELRGPLLSDEPAPAQAATDSPGTTDKQTKEPAEKSAQKTPTGTADPPPATKPPKQADLLRSFEWHRR